MKLNFFICKLNFQNYCEEKQESDIKLINITETVCLESDW